MIPTYFVWSPTISIAADLVPDEATAIAWARRAALDHPHHQIFVCATIHSCRAAPAVMTESLSGEEQP